MGNPKKKMEPKRNYGETKDGKEFRKKKKLGEKKGARAEYRIFFSFSAQQTRINNKSRPTIVTLSGFAMFCFDLCAYSRIIKLFF